MAEAKPKPKRKITKIKRPVDKGVVGYRHLPVKQKRFQREKPPKDLKKLPSAFKITKDTCLVIWENRLLFLGIVVVYALLYLLLVKGFSANKDITTLKNELQKKTIGEVTSSASIFAALIGSAGNGGSTIGRTYELPLALVASLAIIWALRQVKSGNKIRIRDAYYKGMYPIVPFVLILLTIVVQLMPLIIGASLYSLVITDGIAVGFFEQAISLMLFLTLAAWSIYMLCSSIFALYIATLPDMTPMKALRSASELVKFRRLSIFRKLLFLPLMLFVLAALILLPFILWLTSVSQWIFFTYTMLAVLVFHSYLYTMYRELLSE